MAFSQTFRAPYDGDWQEIIQHHVRSLNFGKVALNSTKLVGLSLKSTGTLPVDLTGIFAMGNFSQQNTCPTSLAPGDSCSVSVTFAPTSEGTQLGTISVLDNTLKTPQKVKLTGRGG